MRRNAAPLVIRTRFLGMSPRGEIAAPVTRINCDMLAQSTTADGAARPGWSLDRYHSRVGGPQISGRRDAPHSRAQWN